MSIASDEAGEVLVSIDVHDMHSGRVSLQLSVCA
jgi:hypothetical protein